MKSRSRRRPPQGRGQPAARIAPDSVVALAYRLFDDAGTLRDRVPASQPLRYVHGYAQIIPALEQALAGCRPGQRCSVWLEPADAFGERDEAAVLLIDRDDLGDRPAAIGDEVLAVAPDGSERAYRVIEVREDELVVDLNHPLAGRRVRFELEVLTVRPATDTEIDAAQAEAHERLVDGDTIVYGSGATALVELRTTGPREKNGT